MLIILAHIYATVMSEAHKYLVRVKLRNDLLQITLKHG